MRNILSKQNLRYLETLEFLYHNNSSTFEHLAFISDVSTQTITEDIKRINDIIFPLYIETSQLKCHLILKNDISIDYIYSCILTHSTEYNLLEKIFFEEHDRLEDYADSLFISLSTLKRLISKINKETMKLGFKITANPIQLVGDDWLICNTMINYFREKYLDRQYPFSEVQRKVFDQLLLHLIRNEETKYLNFPDMEKFRIIVFVSLIRLQNGHNYEASYVSQHKSDYSFPILDNPLFKQAFKSVFQIELNETTIFELTCPMVSDRFALNQEEALSLTQSNDTLKKELELITKLISDLSDSLEIELDLDKKNKLVFELINTRLDKMTPSYLLYNVNLFFLQNLSNEFPLIYDFLHNTLTSHHYFSNFKENEMNHFIYILVSHWNELVYKIQYSYPTFKVGILMDKDIEHSHFISCVLNQRYQHYFIFEPIDVMTHQEAINEFENYDLITTNISNLANYHSQVISIDPYPSEKDFAKFYQIYYDLCERMSSN